MKGKIFRIINNIVALSFLGIALSGCGGGGNSAPPSTVSGIAATGAPMSGTAFLKDAANNSEISTTINAQNGAFSFDVSGKTAPFLLRAGSLYSMSGGPGTANINPLSNLMVADMGSFKNMSSLNTFYRNPSGPVLSSMFGNMSTARLHLRQKMGPLMSAYGVVNADPMSGAFTIGRGMDKMFDDVKMTIDSNGNVTMMYVNGTSVFTGQMGNMAGGTMLSGNIMTPGANPVVNGITITPGVAKLQVNGTQQFATNIQVTWSVISQNGGSITSGGLYTAPALQGMYLVKATSVADPTKSAIATVMVGNMGMTM
ncbi:MAG TPA: hypothetical protein VGJ93_01945 [Desulfuromonadaceae bacterium]|jgi:hypothetical protein